MSVNISILANRDLFFILSPGVHRPAHAPFHSHAPGRCDQTYMYIFIKYKLLSGIASRRKFNDVNFLSPGNFNSAEPSIFQGG